LSKKKMAVSTAAEWTKKNQQVRTVKLPSGAVVKVKVMSLFDLAAIGHIPMALVGEVLKSADAFLRPVDPKDMEFEWAKVTEKQIENMLTLFRKAAVAAVVEPKLSFEPENEDAADVMLIDFEDLAEIFSQSVKEGAAEMLPFRAQQKPGNRGGQGGKAVRSETVSNDRDSRPA